MPDYKSNTSLDQLRKKERYSDIINSFAKVLQQCHTEEEIVWTVTKHAIAKINYLDCIVYLVNEETNKLEQRAAHGPKNPIDFDINNPISLNIGEGIVGAVAEHGQPELIKDTSKDPRYLEDDASRLSEIAVPIFDQNDRIIGVIDSEHPEKDFYTEEDIEILTTVAILTSSKLIQAQSTKALEEHKDMLEQLVEEKTASLRETVGKLQLSVDESNKKNEENEVLMQEIHHRVKNNMQVISSLLNMHLRLAISNHEIQVFEDCKQRINSMAMVHDMLYRKGHLSDIDITTYIPELVRDLLRSYDPDNKVNFTLQAEPTELPIDTMIPLGLIINELVVNCLKHAFNEQAQGTVTISLLSEKQHELTISDNGSGIPSDVQTSMGTELIELLADQIDASIEQHSDDGTTSCIRFN